MLSEYLLYTVKFIDINRNDVLPNDSNSKDVLLYARSTDKVFYVSQCVISCYKSI